MMIRLPVKLIEISILRALAAHSREIHDTSIVEQ